MIIKYNGQKEYLLNIAGLTRKLPIIEVEKAKTWIASFVMLGDPELTLNCAKKLLNKIKEINFDYIIIPEAKAIPLAETICQLLRAKGKN